MAPGGEHTRPGKMPPPVAAQERTTGSRGVDAGFGLSDSRGVENAASRRCAANSNRVITIVGRYDEGGDGRLKKNVTLNLFLVVEMSFNPLEHWL